MSERKINLEEIINDELHSRHLYFNKLNTVQIKNICLEFGKQLLELAAENVVIKNICDDCDSENLDIIDGYFHCKDCDRMDYTPRKIVNKQSILDTINQVE